VAFYVSNFFEKTKMEKTNKRKSVWGWIFGILFLLIALAYIFSSFLASLVLIAATLFIFPPTVGILRKKWNLELSKKGKMMVGIIGMVLFFLLAGGPDVETAEIKIEKGDSDPKEVVEAAQIIIDLVDDFQDAQLNTVALLSVKFETADKDEYLEYIKEVEDKWEKVEKSAKQLKKIKEKGGKVPPVSSTSLKLTNIAWADSADSLKFDDVMSNDTASDDEMNEDMMSDDAMTGSFDGGTEEVSLGNQMFEGNVFEQARVYKSIVPDSTTIGYLMDHFKITAKEAQEKLEEYHKVVGKLWGNDTAIYGAASKTAQGIAYGSKVSLYVLGTVSSFGAAAAAESGGAVILGYMGSAWGAALGGADIALDIAEGASIVSTGEGLNHYKKNKEFLGNMNTMFAIFNVGKMAVTGIPKFDGDNFQVADDFMAFFGMGELANNMATEKEGEKMTIKVGKSVKFPKGTPVEEIIKHYHKEEFEYNKVALITSVDEKGDITVQEVSVSGKDESCQPGNPLVKLIESGENPLDVWWPTCKSNVFSKASCRHLPNTCSYKEKCICQEGYSAIPNKNDVVVSCIPDKDWERMVSGQFMAVSARPNVESCRKLRAQNPEASDEWFYMKWAHCRQVGDVKTELDPEVEKMIEKINDPRLEEKSKKAMKCDL